MHQHAVDAIRVAALTETEHTLERIRASMEACRTLASKWAGVAYRSTIPKYARDKDLLSGEGSRIHGGRWNAPGSFAAVYASLDPETAMAETLAHFRYYGIAEQSAMPRLFVAIEVSLSHVVDVCDEQVRRRLHVSRSQLCEENWRVEQLGTREALTQCIGRAAFDVELEAIVVPSAVRAGGSNLVIFPRRLRSRSSLRVLGS